MEIRIKNKLKTMLVEDLPMMNASLVYNKETNDYEIYIRKSDDNALVIQNASNDRQMVILSARGTDEVLFAGKIDDMDIINIGLSL